MKNQVKIRIGALKRNRPDAVAMLQGSAQYPELTGGAAFYQLPSGVLVRIEVRGLPNDAHCDSPIFACHIHAGSACSGTQEDPFAATDGHYNPRNCPHPYHAGDMPPLFGVDGAAYSVFLTGRFTVAEILGKTVVIHAALDDFTTQPAGNAGTKIACGVIRGKEMPRE